MLLSLTTAVWNDTPLRQVRQATCFGEGLGAACCRDVEDLGHVLCSNENRLVFQRLGQHPQPLQVTMEDQAILGTQSPVLRACDTVLVS